MRTFTHIHTRHTPLSSTAQVVCKPGTTRVFSEFEGEVYALTKEEGGRHTPFTTNYRPQFFFRTADVTGTVSLPEETPMVMPGDSFTGACVRVCVCVGGGVARVGGCTRAHVAWLWWRRRRQWFIISRSMVC
jgi:hypothetical protein